MVGHHAYLSAPRRQLSNALALCLCALRRRLWPVGALRDALWTGWLTLSSSSCRLTADRATLSRYGVVLRRWLLRTLCVLYGGGAGLTMGGSLVARVAAPTKAARVQTRKHNTKSSRRKSGYLRHHSYRNSIDKIVHQRKRCN
jgi:hypothetical protein